jgi:branched-chain amino acid aminotransferase
MKYNFDVKKTTTPKQKPNPDNLMFGREFTDHMFVMDYNPEKGWHDGQIVPYGPIKLDPAASVLHYGQEFFEGMKAYRAPSGDVQLFRPHKNAERINSSADRMCMPQMDAELFVSAVKALVDLERDWIPEKKARACIFARLCSLPTLS